jgi:hypothetical protein
MLLLVLSPKLLNFITFLPFLNLFTGSKLMREFNTKFSLSHIKLFTLVILHTFILFLALNVIVLRTRSSSLVTLNRPSNNSRLKITNRSFYHTAPALWNSLPPDLRHFSSHSTSSQPNLNSPLFSLSPSVFLKKTKNSSFSLFFSSLVSRPRRPLDGYLRN